MNLQEEADKHIAATNLYANKKASVGSSLRSNYEHGLLNFIAGANSEYVQQQIIKAKIEVLKSIYIDGNAEELHSLISNKLQELKQQLK